MTTEQPTGAGQQHAVGGADHQTAWGLDHMVEKFAAKTATDFFRSETRFMPEIASARSVLDVGCASGRLIELLDEHLAPGYAFTGVDVVADSIELARATYPDHRFAVGNFPGIDVGGPFDFVNATGVVQHEPGYRALIEAMVAAATGWVLFDAKLSPRPDDVVDRDRSYVTIDDRRLYFNVLAFGPLVAWLRRLGAVRSVSVYGYPAEPNQRTTVPAELGPFAAAGVFLTLGEGSGPADITLDVPPFLSEVVA